MDDSLYSDGEKSDGAEESTETNDSVDEESAEHQTALLPVSAFGGSVKAGDTGTWKAIKQHGEEVEVRISSGDESESTDTNPSADDEFDAMAKE